MKKLALLAAMVAVAVAPIAAQTTRESQENRNTGGQRNLAKARYTDAKRTLPPSDAPPAQRGTTEPVLSPCLVSAINEAQVPGQEPGVLVELSAKEGDEVNEGEVLGKIDDMQPYLQGRIAQEEYKAAMEKAATEVDVKYARKASEVAKKEWEKSVEANKRTPGAITQVDLDRQYLTWERGLLEIERAQSDRKIASFTANAKAGEIEAAKEAMKRREIRSPVDGRVVQVHLHRGEWVRPGDPVLHVVQLDRLKVEGYPEISQFAAGQLIDRPVTIEAVSQDQTLEFKGKITFVSPLIEGIEKVGTYRIKAEVENRKENGEWLLKPGMYVDMKIHLR
jgi:macrolide-specific efflux system membrane fusion protein